MNVRIIPADAGSTGPASDLSWCHQDHPRGCGEHYGLAWRILDAQGSSPRMRGAHPKTVPVTYHGGIIPADAGSTEWVKSRIGKYEDHPRGCGEHAAIDVNALAVLGSSPRMRGARLIHLKRLIASRDHPRGCGEHQISRVVKIAGVGSSPRMRGALYPNQIVTYNGRIIPADAGSTCGSQ